MKSGPKLDADRLILTASYFLSHLAAFSMCVGLWVAVPFFALLVCAIIWNDPGGPLFWPIFLILLFIGGVTCAAVLSFLTLAIDLARSRWHFQIWIPPLAIMGIVICLVLFKFGPTANTMANGFLFGAIASLMFSAYWLAVSSLRFLPRFLARHVSERSRSVRHACTISKETEL